MHAGSAVQQMAEVPFTQSELRALFQQHAGADGLVAASLLCDECHALCPTEPVTLVTVAEDCKYQAACGVLSREVTASCRSCLWSTPAASLSRCISRAGLTG